MMTAVVDDSLWVWDFDYINQRKLVQYIDEAQIEEKTTDIEPITTISKTKLANYSAVIAENNVGCII